jgi:carbamoylphosphate synthase large subunit
MKKQEHYVITTDMLKRKPKFTYFRPKILSRHSSHEPLRSELPLLPFRSVVRLGSSTQLRDDVSSNGNRIECNTVVACRTSADKRLMKEAFDEHEIDNTAIWWVYNPLNQTFYDGGYDYNDQMSAIEGLPYPIVAKHRFGSRGTGNYLLSSMEQLQAWMKGKRLENYIFEKFYSYTREYRLHVTADGCFYTCRKMLREDTPEDQRWYRNDSNSNWIREDNELFDKPVNWEEIEQECVKAIQAVGLDIGACDVKVQSAKTAKGKVRPAPEFIILETNSAPSFGDLTLEKYLEEIPKVLLKKIQR